MDRIDLLYRLEFDDQSSFDKEIQPMDADLSFAVKYTDRKLSLKANSAGSKFNAESFLVKGFEESRAKGTMNLDGSSYDRFGQFIIF